MNKPDGIETELGAIELCIGALSMLSVEAEHRALEYLVSRHNQRLREFLDRATNVSRLEKIAEVEKK